MVPLVTAEAEEENEGEFEGDNAIAKSFAEGCRRNKPEFLRVGAEGGGGGG